MGIRSGVYQAKESLRQQGRLGNITQTIPCTIPTEVRFVYCAECLSRSPEQIRPIYEEKKNLLLSHYNHRREFGRHAEQLVKNTCQELQYAELETNKTSHNGVGIRDREIDVFGKHPNGGYYQAISVKNTRESMKSQDIDDVITTARIASRAWQIDIRPALVATYASRFKLQEAKSKGCAMAIWGKQIIPERFREEYETRLIPGLLLDIQIADIPPQEMVANISHYICGFRYRPNDGMT